ncbi:MAG: peptide-methionine (S)-S-oxide reductase MsrA [Pseudomonadota bacterium]
MRILTIMLAALLPAAAAKADTQTAVFAGGCFWCVESDFEPVDGVIDVVSGLTGGTKEDPTYRSYGDHREAVMITFDPEIVSYEDLVDGFVRSIDPTDAGGQFCDRGFTYSTAIYTATPEQERAAKSVLSRYEQLGILPDPIVTEVAPSSTFYKVGDYHQDYYKSDAVIITRFGPLSKANAYKRYRKACGRDARTQELWGDRAFIKAGL